jgi:hypothetical protein
MYKTALGCADGLLLDNAVNKFAVLDQYAIVKHWVR